ncbi:gluconokinase [Mucilaginibacter terrae]|uniref:Gluconokinase n=1 Tax=Mucilaginibacter terrae TaxID=1955052 RepID=A0ABU3H0B4_9SPHI|nr:gluconokinase [Mucilaginibacter terrae]MDT3405454.1 gluconokinase [Mucilaginibacter terrae]
MNCIITIELGTNAVRVFAFDLKGEVIGFKKGTYPTFHEHPDHSEQDPEQMFITMLYVLKKLLNEVVYAAKLEVSCICFSSSMHSLLAVDKDGIPLGNAITWADNRGKKEAGTLKGTALGNALYEATGTPIHPMSPLVKIAWLRNNDPERFKITHKFLSIKSYIIQQLTGTCIIDHSIASATGLMNIHSMEWDRSALDFAGISAQRLPDLVPVFFSDIKLKREYQNSLRLSSAVKILIGSSDGCLATLGAGVWDAGRATITIEDSGAFRVIGKEVINDPMQQLFNYRLTNELVVSGGPTNNGGVIFEWFANQLGEQGSSYDIDQAFNMLIREASTVPAGSDGLLFLPYLLGERAPIWNANARGCYFGLHIRHERQHMIRATIEGILFEMFSIGKTMEAHRKIESLSINGSFASIPFCTQMIADMFNRPVNTLSHGDSIGVGAFLLSATDLGIFSDLETASKQVRMHQTFLPDAKAHDIYQQYFRIFENLIKKLGDEFDDLASLSV